MNPLLHRFLHQFHLPHGPFGHVAGWFLAAKGDRARPLVAAAELAPDDAVLDIGCGPGVAIALAAAEVPRGSVTGVDPSRVMVGQARRRTRRAGNVTVVEAPAEALPLPDASVDVTWALNTLHHWADRDAGLAEVRRVTRPGGRFLVVEQDRRGTTGGALDDATAARLGEALAGAGFADVQVSTFESGGEAHTLVRSTVPAATPVEP